MLPQKLCKFEVHVYYDNIHRVLFSEIQRTTVTYHSMTLKILSTHEFDTGIAIIYCRSFNKIEAGSWLNSKEYHI